MIDDFRKSIKLILSDRLSSPFSGAFLISWCVWNWRIAYFLFASDATMSFETKLSFIESNYLNYQHNLILPFISAIFLITIYPFLTTGSLWIWLKFRKWQVDLKNQIDKQQLLTLEQSVSIRLELEEYQDKIDRLMRVKNEELQKLRVENEQLRMLNQNRPVEKRKITAPIQTSDQRYDEDFEEFLSNSEVVSYFPTIMDAVQNSSWITTDLAPGHVLSYYTSNDIITRRDPKESKYDFTAKGKYFVKQFLRRGRQNR